MSKKIKSLRSQYTREKQKERRNRELAIGESTFVSKWMHYEKLNFLEEFVVPRQHTAGLKVSMLPQATTIQVPSMLQCGHVTTGPRLVSSQVSSQAAPPIRKEPK